MDRPTLATSERFGYMWNTAARLPLPPPISYHLAEMQSALGAPPFAGRVLDAGCGEGIDLAGVSHDARCRAVGVELSRDGALISRAHAPAALVARGDVRSLPFRDRVFDGAYSYGVVHHTSDPQAAVREIARTLRPGAPLLLYVYEDFTDRPVLWRLALRLTSAVRQMTSRLPPRMLWRLCRWTAPIVYAAVWPARRRGWRWPYHHCDSVAMVVPDLYDRLAPPIERRYSRSGAARLAAHAGLIVRAVARRRGWMVYAEKAAR